MTSTFARGDALPPHLFGPFTDRIVAAYAEASGDDNPLHFDPEIAAQAGLARPPVHGMLLVGCAEPYLATYWPQARIVKISAKFVRPVLTGDGIEISGKIVRLADGEPAVVRLTVRGGAARDIACLAEIFVVP